MKKWNLLFLLFILLSGTIFYSCNSVRYYEFSHRTGLDYSEKVVVEKEAQINNKTVAETSKKVPDNLTSSNSSELLAAETVIEKSEPIEDNVKIKHRSASAGIEQIKHTETGKKERMHELILQKFKKQDLLKNGNLVVDTKELLFAIFLPPVGVLMHEDEITYRFWLSLVLTFIFIIPGSIYAVLVVTDKI